MPAMEAVIDVVLLVREFGLTNPFDKPGLYYFRVGILRTKKH
jgi:hypothetical protein